MKTSLKNLPESDQVNTASALTINGESALNGALEMRTGLRSWIIIIRKQS